MCPILTWQNRGDEKDMNIRGAWEDGFSGLGIVVTIMDDGLEKDHPDLIVNYVRIPRQFYYSILHTYRLPISISLNYFAGKLVRFEAL